MKTSEKAAEEKELARLVMESVQEFTGIPIEVFVGKSRKNALIEARHLSMYFIRSKTNLRLIDIAKLHNKKTHVPVLHGCNKVRDMSKHERVFSQRLAKLKAKIDLIKVTEK